MNKKYYFCYLIVFSIAISSFIGCEKDDVNIDSGTYRVKVYNDSLAGIDNPDAKIAAGAGRLYMTYGQGGWNGVTVGYFTFAGYSVDYSVQVMSTDNDGTFLWRNKLPISNVSVGGLMELNNGNCLVVAFKNDWSFSDQIYLITYDSNGQLASTDSVVFAIPINGLPSINTMKLMKTPNGNFILYGNFQDSNGWQAYAFEYTQNFNLTWAKAYNYFPSVPPFNYPGTFVTGCSNTPDGGYLFVGGATPDPTITYFGIIVIKTNSTGDTIWTKNFDFEHDELVDFNASGNIIPLTNGNYRFNFTSGVGKALMSIYEINALGDSVNAITIDEMNQNYGAVMLPDNDGGSFALMNTNSVSGGIFHLRNTMYLNFNSGLKIVSKGKFQTQTTDVLTAACITSEGKKACFGMIQSYGASYSKPELIILN